MTDFVAALARKWCVECNHLPSFDDWEVQCQEKEGPIPATLCEDCATAAIREALQLHGKVCGICWTSSWTPIPPEEENNCGLNHPHEGDHARCECCWLHKEEMKESYLRTPPPINEARETARACAELVISLPMSTEREYIRGWVDAVNAYKCLILKECGL